MTAFTPSPSHPKLFWLVLFGVAYLGGCWLGHWLTLMPVAGVTLWPPSGLYLAALLIGDKRHWPWWTMAGLPAEIIGSMALFGLPLPAVLAIYLGNTLEALAGAWLVRRWCGAAFRLDDLKAVLVLTLCGAVLSPALSATLGAVTLTAIGRGSFAGVWPLWWMGDAVGVLIVTPLVLSVIHSGTALWRVKSGRWAEWLAMLAVFVNLAYLVFSGEFPFVYIIFPPLLWATLRFGVPGAAATMLILTLMAARYTAAGRGVFANPAFDPEQRQWLVQLYLGIAAVTALVVAALATQSRRALLTLRQAHDELDARVTERTAALRESEERYRTIFEASRDGIATVAPDGPILDANPAYQAMLGYTLDELKARTYQQLTLPRWHAIEDAILQERVLALGDSGEYEKEYIRKDGSVFPISIRTWPLRDAAGCLTGFQAIVRDITERKQAEEALQASEERFRAVFEHAATGIAIADLEGRFQQCNPAYRRLLGCTEAELRQITSPDLVHPDDRAANLVEIRRLQDEDLPYFEIENRYLRKDGETVWVRKFVSLLRDAAGKPSRLVVLITDITEQRRMEEALREADQRKDEFLATLAHELRNPLAPIHNALQLLRRTSGSEPASERLLAMMQRQVDHLVRLVDDLLEVSRISRGKIDLRKERIDLAAVASHALETSRPLIETAGHALSVDLPPEPIILEADPVRLAQVLANLLNNAAKYTEPGGRIRLAAERRNGEAVVSVIDSGVGIPAEMLTRVFDLFAQVDRSLGRAQGGLGIGLALVRSLVEMHGGQVEVHSDGIGRGSEFSVHLPLAEARPMQASQPDKPLAGPGPSRRVLVVDDNRDAADSLGLLLEALNYEVRVLYNGAAALNILDEFRPAVVLLDIGMPGMDGYETARRIRQHPQGRDVSLIALTGWGQEEDRRRTQEAGFDQHLVKPVDVELLRGLLAGVK